MTPQSSAGLDAPACEDGFSSEVISASWVIEQFEIEAGRASDQSRIRRTLGEAVASWPGEPEQSWWSWIVEAGQSLALSCRPVDCTLYQIWELAREGGRLIIRIPATGEWIGVYALKGRKLAVVAPSSGRRHQKVSQNQLQRLLGFTVAGSMIRCVVFQPQLSGKLAEEHHEGSIKPFARAWGFLRPESGDIRIVLVFAVVSGVLALATPLAIEALVSTVTFGRLLQPIFVLSLLLLAFLMFQAAIRGLQTFVAEIIQRRLFARVAADLAFRLPRVKAESLEGHNRRELVNRFFEIVTVQKVTAQLLLDGVSIAVNTLVGMAVLGFYHPWLLGFDVVLLAMITFVIVVMGRGAIATSIKESKLKYQVASWLEDLSGCPIAFRYDGAPQFALGRTDQLIHGYLTARRKHFKILLRQILFALGLQAVASTALLGLGGWLVISGELTLGQLVAAELIVTVIVGSFAKLGKHMESFYDMMASVDKLGHLFDLPIERQDGILTLQNKRPSECGCSQVVYHTSTGRSVFDRFDLAISAGERVALSGSSGSGKSILLDLFCGLRTPQQGYIRIDGIDLRELRPDVLWRSVVLVRDVEVFEGTLMQNVHLERPEVTSEQVHMALEQVGLLTDLLDLPHGLDTPINASGYPLSPNQLRKLMLARAIVGRPTLLLIDGLLDALPDDQSEPIMQVLCDSSQPWTLVLVTARERLAEIVTRRIDLGGVQHRSRENMFGIKESSHG